MRRYGRMIAVVALLAVAPAAVAGIAGATGETIYVVIDRGIESSFPDAQVRSLQQLGEYMEEDLIRLLERAGYDARLLNDESGYKGGAGYLLVVRFMTYNPGWKGAPGFVRHGEGATSMNIRYDLKDASGNVIRGDDLGVGSSRDWRRVVRKLGERITAGVKKSLS